MGKTSGFKVGLHGFIRGTDYNSSIPRIQTMMHAPQNFPNLTLKSVHFTVFRPHKDNAVSPCIESMDVQ